MQGSGFCLPRGSPSSETFGCRPVQKYKPSWRTGDKLMNRKKLTLGIGVIAAVLALSLAAFAAVHVAVSPGTAVISLANPAPVTFDGFCSNSLVCLLFSKKVCTS